MVTLSVKRGEKDPFVHERVSMGPFVFFAAVLLHIAPAVILRPRSGFEVELTVSEDRRTMFVKMVLTAIKADGVGGYMAIGWGDDQLMDEKDVVVVDYDDGECEVRDMNTTFQGVPPEDDKIPVIAGGECFFTSDRVLLGSFQRAIAPARGTVEELDTRNFVWAFSRFTSLANHVENRGGFLQEKLGDEVEVIRSSTPPPGTAVVAVPVRGLEVSIEEIVGQPESIRVKMSLDEVGSRAFAAIGFGSDGLMVNKDTVAFNANEEECSIVPLRNVGREPPKVRVTSELSERLCELRSGFLIGEFVMPRPSAEASDYAIWAFSRSATISYHDGNRGSWPVALPRPTLPTISISKPLSKVSLTTGLNFEWSIRLDENGVLQVEGEISLKVSSSVNEAYLGIGFGSDLLMANKDMVIGELTGGSRCEAADYVSIRQGVAPEKDAIQIGTQTSCAVRDGFLVLTFVKNLDPMGDRQDKFLSAAEQNVVWAFSKTQTLSWHGSNRGGSVLDLSRGVPSTLVVDFSTPVPGEPGLGVTDHGWSLLLLAVIGCVVLA